MRMYSPARLASQYWWLMLLWGVLVGLFGLCAIFWPHLTLLTLIFLFGAFALINGVLGLFMAMQERTVLPSWGAAMVAATISIIFGLAVMVWPHVTAVIILYLIAFWAIINGIVQLYTAFRGRHRYAPLFLGVSGLTSLALGIILFVVSPLVALLSLVWVIGIYALIYGIVLIVRSFYYRARLSRSEAYLRREPEFLP